MRYFAVALLLVMLAAAVPAVAQHDLDLHWQKRTSSPVTVFLIDQTGGRFPVVEAVQRWNGTGALHLAIRKQCPPQRGCIYVRLRDMNYLGLATLHHDGTHLTKAVVNLSSTRSMTASKRLSITCHELGHAIGLDHRGDVTSCLFNGSRFPTSPDGHDLQQLQAQYTHQH